MDITYNKVDETALPISTNRVSASEYNQIAGSLMHIITTAGLTPDSQNNAQLLNALKQAIVNFPYITETYHNGTDWYRVWSDGWCEQGGLATQTSVSLLKPMADTNYTVMMTQVAGGSAYAAQPTSLTTTGFTYTQYQGAYNAYWEVKGYIS